MKAGGWQGKGAGIFEIVGKDKEVNKLPSCVFVEENISGSKLKTSKH